MGRSRQVGLDQIFWDAFRKWILSDLENIWKTVGAPFSPTKFTGGDFVSDNDGYFVTFSAMAWIGLGSTWYCYINFQHKHEVVGRAYTAIVVVVLGLIIAILANVCCNKTTRRHENAVWNQVAAKEDNDGIAEDSPNIEMGSFRSQSSRETDMDNDVDMERQALATLHECLGRPTISKLLGAGSTRRLLFTRVILLCPTIAYAKHSPGCQTTVTRCSRLRRILFNLANEISCHWSYYR